MADLGVAPSSRMLATRMRDRVESVKEAIDDVFDALLMDLSLLASSAASDGIGGDGRGAFSPAKTQSYPEGGRGGQIQSLGSVGARRQGLTRPPHQPGTVRDAHGSSCNGERFHCEPKVSILGKQDSGGASECGANSFEKLKHNWRNRDISELESGAPKGLAQDGRSCPSFGCESETKKSAEQHNRSCHSVDCESEAPKQVEEDAPLGVWELEERLHQELFETRSLRGPSKTRSESGRQKTPTQSCVDSVNQAASQKNANSIQDLSQGLRSKLDGLLPQVAASGVDAKESPDEALLGTMSNTMVRHPGSEPVPQTKTCSQDESTTCKGRDPKLTPILLPATQPWSREGALATPTIDSEHGMAEGKTPDNLGPSQVWRRRFAILPLVVCGLYPRDIGYVKPLLGRKRQWHALAYQSFMTVFVLACLVAQVWRFSGKVGPAGAVVVKSGRLSETAITLGSLIGLCSVHTIACGPPILDAVGVLRYYTGSQGVCDLWTKRSCLDTFVTLAFWAAGVLLRVCTDGSVAGAIKGNMDAQDFRGTLAFIVVSGTALNLAGIILFMNRAMVLLVDGFCANSMACTGIDWRETTRQWNLVHSVLRHTCRMIQVCFMIIQVIVFVSVVCISVELWNSKQTLLETFLAVSPTLIICAGLTRTLSSAADVTNRCERIPCLISSAQKDGIIDAPHHYFLSYLSSCAAGFYIFGARLTSVVAFKFLYILSVLGFAVLSRLAD